VVDASKRVRDLPPEEGFRYCCSSLPPLYRICMGIIGCVVPTPRIARRSA
jgi:hypothetical protein